MHCCKYLVILFACLFFGGCSNPKAQTPQGQPAEQEAISSKAPVETAHQPEKKTKPQKTVKRKDGLSIELLESGRNPTKLLSYKFAQNNKIRMAWEAENTHFLTHNKKQFSPSETFISKQEFEITVDEVDDDNIAQISFKLLSDKYNRKKKPKKYRGPEVFSMFDKETSFLKGTHGTLLVDSQGRVELLDVIFPKAVEKKKKKDQLKARVTEPLWQLFVYLPDEPVGIGARWRVTQPVETHDFKFKHLALFELLKNENGQIKVSVNNLRHAFSQEFVPEHDSKIRKEFDHIFFDSIKNQGKETRTFHLQTIGFDSLEESESTIGLSFEKRNRSFSLVWKEIATSLSFVLE